MASFSLSKSDSEGSVPPAAQQGRRRVSIVGVGPSGLTALKELREVGLDAIAVDSRADIGSVLAGACPGTSVGRQSQAQDPPIFDGLQGEVMDYAQYHSAEQVRGKKVLVVGVCESATNVTHSADEVAHKVIIWGRQYPDIAPRFIVDLASRRPQL